jgi:hypothetical protein
VSVYVDGRGQQLGPPKTEGARGEHWLMPTVVAMLTKRLEVQAEERAAAPVWETITYEGERLHLVSTTPTGGLVLRQTVAKMMKQAAKTAGITAQLGTLGGGRWSRPCSWRVTRRWRTLPGSSGMPSRRPPPAL